MRKRKLLLAVVTAIAALAGPFVVASPAQALPPLFEDWFRLVNVATIGTSSMRCLAVQGPDLHTEAINTGCGRFNDQFFKYEKIGQVEDTPYYRLRKFNTNLCLYANGTGTGARIKQYTCGT